jgi:hypothetical protein
MDLWDWNINTTQNKKTKTKGTWDKGIDYEQIYKTLKKDLEKLKNKEILYKHDYKKITYLITFITQLRNGCRIWEAINAMVNYTLNLDKINWENPIINIRIEKRKDGATRKIILPKCINEQDIQKVKHVFLNIKKEIDEQPTTQDKLKTKEKIIKRFGAWLYKNYGINSHSLRYAYITHLGTKNIPAQVLAKVSGHKNINHLEHYTQSKIGEIILREIGDIDDFRGNNKTR